jgi:2-polyprenyl-6-methoxyphenol hydroxylase-like FAD-dependent oxidoreductase
VVVGAGVSGLKAALDLQDKGYHVTVIEARDVRHMMMLYKKKRRFAF